MNASSVRIQIMQMEVMYRSILAAQQDPVLPHAAEITKYANFEDYIERTLNNMAIDSHGDIVLMDGNVEMKRVKAIYPKIPKRKNLDR